MGTGNVRRNKNRGYQQLRVWEDAVEFYRLTCGVFRMWPYELKRVASQEFASADSIHRNIAAGYCRRGIREYLQHLYMSLGSLGESVSGLHAYHRTAQVTEEQFEQLDSLAYRLKNGLLKLVEALERKKQDGDWIDSLIVKEANAVYTTGTSSPRTP